MRKIFYEFCQNAYIHCLHYIVDKFSQWLERFFWFICISISTGSVIYVVREFLAEYDSTRASLSVKTDYINFKTPFPSVVFCEYREIPGKTGQVLEMLNLKYNVELDNFIRQTVFFHPLAAFYIPTKCYNEEMCRNFHILETNFSFVSQNVRASCEETFASCSFNNKPFNCCTVFIPVNTIQGKCFAFNNILAVINANNTAISRKKGKIGGLRSNLNYWVEYKPQNNPANLSIELAHKKFDVWQLSFNELPSKAFMRNKIRLFDADQHYRFIDVYSRIEEIIAEPSVHNLPINRRRCRYFHEKEILKNSRKYSISSCETECFNRIQQSYCNCSLNFLPNQIEKICHQEQMKCIVGTNSIVYHTSNCKCETICDNLDVFVISVVENIKKIMSFRTPKSQVQINFLINAPLIQYVRQARQEPLDIIVSIGGAISLFIGCSFLTAAQVFHYFVLKPLNRYIMKKQNLKWKKKVLT